MKNHWLPIAPVSEALPIFQSEMEGRVLFYAPGVLAAVPLESSSVFLCSLQDGDTAGPASALRQLALHAREERENSFRLPYTPLCLTLYLNDTCDLACIYCYTGSGSERATLLPVEAIRAAAERVAQNCQEAGAALTVVFHGGGEPARNQRHLAHALSAVEETAQKHGLALFRYITTGGACDGDTADWLARHFERVGLSCDGPDEIQGQQRPRQDGAHSLSFIERTAEALHQHGTPFDVRVTVTPFSIYRQEEIARYICEKLAPQEIHVEPVYRGGRTAQGFPPEMAEIYAAEFLRARAVAAGYQVRWSGSAGRPWEIHGPYCNVQRSVLNLMPDGAATACFKMSSRQDAKELVIADMISGSFEIDQQQVERLRRRLHTIPEGCQACFNQYHCVWACPDACSLREGAWSAQGTFRCRVSQILADAAIRGQVSSGPHGIQLMRIEEW
jgi:radical SAM protein with 4Fe4S-binding SPASM domain